RNVIRGLLCQGEIKSLSEIPGLMRFGNRVESCEDFLCLRFIRCSRRFEMLFSFCSLSNPPVGRGILFVEPSHIIGERSGFQSLRRPGASSICQNLDYM